MSNLGGSTTKLLNHDSYSCLVLLEVGPGTSAGGISEARVRGQLLRGGRTFFAEFLDYLRGINKAKKKLILN